MYAQTLGLGRSSPQALARLLAARGAPRERHEEEYWVADSGATESMTQDSYLLEGYTPAPSGDEVESADGVCRKCRRGFSPCRRIRAPTTVAEPR